MIYSILSADSAISFIALRVTAKKQKELEEPVAFTQYLRSKMPNKGMHTSVITFGPLCVLTHRIFLIGHVRGKVKHSQPFSSMSDKPVDLYDDLAVVACERDFCFSGVCDLSEDQYRDVIEAILKGMCRCEEKVECSHLMAKPSRSTFAKSVSKGSPSTEVVSDATATMGSKKNKTTGTSSAAKSTGAASSKSSSAAATIIVSGAADDVAGDSDDDDDSEDFDDEDDYELAENESLGEEEMNDSLVGDDMELNDDESTFSDDSEESVKLIKSVKKLISSKIPAKRRIMKISSGAKEDDDNSFGDYRILEVEEYDYPASILQHFEKEELKLNVHDTIYPWKENFYVALKNKGV